MQPPIYQNIIVILFTNKILAKCNVYIIKNEEKVIELNIQQYLIYIYIYIYI